MKTPLTPSETQTVIKKVLTVITVLLYQEAKRVNEKSNQRGSTIEEIVEGSKCIAGGVAITMEEAEQILSHNHISPFVKISQPVKKDNMFTNIISYAFINTASHLTEVFGNK